MLLFMSSGLILILREEGGKHYSTGEGGGVYLCMAGTRSPSDIDNRELHLESRPQPRCHSHHLFALLTILRSDLCAGINTAALSPDRRL